MNKTQAIFVGVSLVLTILLFQYGRLIPYKKGVNASAPAREDWGNTTLSFDTLLTLSKKRLSPGLLALVEKKEAEIFSSTDKNQQIEGYRWLARIWMDSVGVFVPFAKYTAEAAKLENSEKNLNFAAQLLLDEVLSVQEKPLQVWMAKEARTLFEQQLQLNPNSDSAKIGLGSCYFFGAAKEGEPPMQGVMLIREIAERDSSNAYAQRMLGVGAAISGQKEKAIERFLNVYRLEPDNMDVLLRLANIYEETGNKPEAKKWYQELINVIKRLEKEKKFNPRQDLIPELEKHIKTLEN
jgi:hypothetical protein